MIDRRKIQKNLIENFQALSETVLPLKTEIDGVKEGHSMSQKNSKKSFAKSFNLSQALYSLLCPNEMRQIGEARRWV